MNAQRGLTLMEHDACLGELPTVRWTGRDGHRAQARASVKAALIVLAAQALIVVVGGLFWTALTAQLGA